MFPQLENETWGAFLFVLLFFLSPSGRHIVPLFQDGDDVPLLQYFRPVCDTLHEYYYNNIIPYPPPLKVEADVPPVSTRAVYANKNMENPHHVQQAQVPIWRQSINGGSENSWKIRRDAGHT